MLGFVRLQVEGVHDLRAHRDLKTKTSPLLRDDSAPGPEVCSENKAGCALMESCANFTDSMQRMVCKSRARFFMGRKSRLVTLVVFSEYAYATCTQEKYTYSLAACVLQHSLPRPVELSLLSLPSLTSHTPPAKGSAR